jgi:hypothetical protein
MLHPSWANRARTMESANSSRSVDSVGRHALVSLKDKMENRSSGRPFSHRPVA